MTEQTTRRRPKSLEEWREALGGGERVALARAITAIDNDTDDADTILRAIHGMDGHAQVLGITGAPGVGKSTLVNALIGELRRRGKKIGVIAVDPSSPITGGAILGDRIRMTDHGADPNVFVRSLASRGHLGGLSKATARVVDVMDAAGMDFVVVETVGTGQSEVEIMEIAQTVLVAVAPGLGDEIQAVKAGILEVADILIVNKADMPLVDKTESQLKDALSLSHSEGWQVPVMRTIATSGDGLSDLVDMVDAHYAQLPKDAKENAARERMRRLVAGAAADQARAAVDALDRKKLDGLCEDVLKGERALADAAREAIRLVSGK